MTNALAFVAVIILSPVLGLWWRYKGRPDKLSSAPRRQRWHQVQFDPMVTPRRRIQPTNGDPGRVSRGNWEVPAELRNLFGPPTTPVVEQPWEWLHEDATGETQRFQLFWKEDVER